MAQHDAVLKRLRTEHTGADRQQRVKPSPRLVDGFADKVRRKPPLELFFVLKRIMPLGKRHRTGIIPAVDDLVDAAHLFAALRAILL